MSSRNLHIRALNSYSVSAALGQTYPSAGLLLPTGSQHHNLHIQMKALELMRFNTDNTLSNTHSELSVAYSAVLATGSTVQHLQHNIRYIYCTVSTHRTTQLLQCTVQHLQCTVRHLQHNIRYVYCTVSTHRTTQLLQCTVQHLQCTVRHLQCTVRHLQPTIKLCNRTRKHGKGSDNSSYFVCNVNILRIL